MKAGTVDFKSRFSFVRPVYIKFAWLHTLISAFSRLILCFSLFFPQIERVVINTGENKFAKHMNRSNETLFKYFLKKLLAKST